MDSVFDAGDYDLCATQIERHLVAKANTKCLPDRLGQGYLAFGCNGCDFLNGWHGSILIERNRTAGNFPYLVKLILRTEGLSIRTSDTSRDPRAK